MIALKEDLIKILKSNINENAFLAFTKLKYYLPTEEEIRLINSFYSSKFLNNFNVKSSINWNCRSYAESYKVFANLYHANFIKSAAGSIALGNMFIPEYKNSKGHVMNLVFYIKDKESDVINYHFLDSLGNFEKLTKGQLKTIELIVF